MKLARIALSAFAAMFFSMTAFAGTVAPFDQKTFDDLTQSGKPVVVSVRAPWCPICKVQAPIEQSVMDSDAFKNVTLLTVDFDSQKDVVKELKVPMQSAIIVYKGGEEVGRSVGDKKKDSIEALMNKAI
jgi:thioredoxin 1